MPQFDVLCVGNAKIDAFLFIHHAASHIKLDENTNEFCIKAGEKIELDNISFLLGGNACNIAVGLAKLGLKSSLIAEIGNDEFAQKIISSLLKEGVDTRYLRQARGEGTPLSIIISFRNERTIFSQHLEKTHDFSFDNISAKWVYLTSLGNEWKGTHDKILEFVKKNNAKLAFNPGTLQIEKGYEAIKDVLEITNILFVNKEEAMQTLRIKDEGLRIKDLLNGIKQLGPKTVVVTDGENGSYAVNEKGELLTQPPIQTEIVEKTGAGDAYASGFLAAILSNLPIQTAMKWGSLNASATMKKIGAQNGLLTREKMEKANA